MKNIFIKLIMSGAFVSLLFGCSDVSQSKIGSEDASETIESTVKASSANLNMVQDKQQRSAKIVNLTGSFTEKWKITEQKLGQDSLIDVFFVNTDHGWLVSNNELKRESAKIYKTVDSGKTWIQLSVDIPANSFISKIFFLDETRGWMVTQTENHESKNIAAEIRILKTDDGGRTWKIQYSLKEAYVSDLVFDKMTGEGWLVGLKGKAGYSFNTDALALHTLDFGKTWNDVSPKFVSKNQSDESVLSSKDSLKEIQLIGNMETFAISQRGQLLRTSDGGKSWETVVRIFDERSSLEFQNLGLKSGSKLWATNEACSIEGQWTLLAIIKENSTIDKYLLNQTCISDVLILPSGELFAAGLKMSLNKAKDGIDTKNIIIYSKDYEKWETIYETSSECNSDCGFNKIATDNNEKYFFAGNNGLFVIITKK